MRIQTKQRTILLLIFLAVALFFGGRSLIFWQIEKSVILKLEELRLQGMEVEYGSLDMTSMNAALEIIQLSIKLPVTNSNCSTRLIIPSLKMSGFSIIPLIFKNRLEVSDVFLDHPLFHYGGAFPIPALPPRKHKNSFFRLHISHLQIDSAALTISGRNDCTQVLAGAFNLTVTNLRVNNLINDSLTWEAGNMVTKDVTVALPKLLYKITLQQGSFHHLTQSVKLDCLQIIPMFDRITFAQKSIRQVDQLKCLIPTLRITGFKMSNSLYPSFQAKCVAVEFELEVFRDKRFQKEHRKPFILPIPFLRNLGIPIHIDTVKITSSSVSYEELPEAGNNSGKIFFRDLTGEIQNICVDTVGDIAMKVHARFMDTGQLNVNFTFPLSKKSSHTVEGSLNNFSMPELNDILVPVKRIKIQSGKLNSLKFHFRYDERESTGALAMFYEDLRVLRIKDDAEGSVNEFVSFLLNAKIKNEINKNDAKEKWQGAIYWSRDTQFGLLNYWWKSLLSGIKEVFNLERSKRKQK